MAERGWMGDTSGGPWGPDDGPDEDMPSCPHCGGVMDWADCTAIDCEDGRYDLSEYDCINYAPGTYATCRECAGDGGWWYCPNKNCKPSQDAVIPESQK